MPAPRAHASRTEKALFLLSRGCCYDPEAEPAATKTDRVVRHDSQKLSIADDGKALVFPGTPTFFLNDEKLEIESFDDLIAQVNAGVES